MAQATRGVRVVGDYVVGRQIGSGSFSVVWHARHRVHGTEVAIKEIVIERLEEKLRESLMSEISILKRINHPNIIRLHDIIQVPGKIHIVLEYCKGGDLSMYITRHGSVLEATAKHFMQQLAAGLQVLRDNNLIHRDLKPQNLLLSTNDDNAVLKIADFGFARSLQPRGLAETLCGSPLYMAPEIMHRQKYDAKADLWSVGAILFQLVTGKTPFTGNDRTELLQNIVKSTELNFPIENKNLSSDCKDLCQKLLRRNPVERLTFEEFFSHPFLYRGQPDDSRIWTFSRTMDDFLLSESHPLKNTEESSQEDCLSFLLDDDSSGTEGSPSFVKRRPSMKSTYGFSIDTRERRESTSNAFNNIDLTSTYGVTRHKLDNTSFRLESNKFSCETLDEPQKSMDPKLVNIQSTGGDPLEMIDQDYVIVSGPSMDLSSSSSSNSKTNHSPPLTSISKTTASTPPMPIIGATNTNIYCTGSSESPNSVPGTSQRSMDMLDVLEQPSSHSMTRIKSLQHCASAIKELVHEKIKTGRHLEAFSIQFVILAIWKQALHICHTLAASAVEGSPSQDSARLRGTGKEHGTPDMEECQDVVSIEGSEDISSLIEREFIQEVERAEEFAKVIEPGSTKMPDAMETIYKAALTLGRHGGVHELWGDMESAALLYSKAVRLLVFLLVEAPSLILNPPFSLTNSDRYRLRTYIDTLNTRQGYSRSQSMSLLTCKDQP